MNNEKLSEFCKLKVGVPYVLGTNGKIFTKSMYDDLVRRNPSGWFTDARLPKLRSFIGKVTTDCHGLIEWFVREQSGVVYDTTADAAFAVAKVKGMIGSIPELPGVCVRYKGHVGVYIGGGYVVEARGFDYGVCKTKLSSRPWTEWYEHPKINYDNENNEKFVKKGMNTKEIQGILNKGGKITFEKSVYDIEKTLLLKSGSIIDLNGSTLRQGGKINHILLTDSDKDTKKYYGVKNLEIYGGTIEGMGKFNTALNLMTICHSSNVFIHDIKFLDTVAFHHLEINSSSGVRVEDCSFEGVSSPASGQDFRECIQIDHATESALVVVPLKSPWYDGTCCENIIIRNCIFRKSGSRLAPSQCIGNHCQVNNGKHKNIIIENNIFEGGNQKNKSGICINLVGMENVLVKGNKISSYGRGIRVHAYEESYDNQGKKEKAEQKDGICRNILIEGNEIEKPSGSYLSSGIYVSSKNGNHESVNIYNNNVKKSGKMKYEIDLNYCNGGTVQSETKFSDTCNGIYKI